jgi:hypothetical protein
MFFVKKKEEKLNVFENLHFVSTLRLYLLFDWCLALTLTIFQLYRGGGILYVSIYK